MKALPLLSARTVFFTRKQFFRCATTLWLVFFTTLSAVTPLIALAQTSDSGAVQVTASVLPTVGDFEFAFAGQTTVPIHQAETATYQITYGTHAYHAASYSIKAFWGKGTIAGQQTASVETLEYASGTATAGYGGAVPIIDTVNRSITWNITNVPPNTTGQTLSFQLKALANYTGDLTVSIPVSAAADIDKTILPDQTTTTEYIYTPTDEEETATPTPTATSDTTTATPTPTQTVSSTADFFDTIALQSKSDTQLSLSVITTDETKLSVKLGTTIKSLTEVQTQNALSRRHTVALEDLLPETTYYLQFRGTTAAGETQTSDVYSFTTAKKNTELPTIDKTSIVLTSGQSLMVGSSLDKDNVENFKIFLPVSKNFEFSFLMEKGKKLQKIEVWMDSNVLGISTFMQKATEPNALKVEVLELLPGRYQGRLLTPGNPGEYKLHARIFDTDGNVTESSFGTIEVVPRLKIIDAKTGKPIEGAQLIFWYWRDSVALFDPLPVEFFGLSNPLYTNPHGESPLALPIGTYRVKVVALGYEEQETDFTLGGTGKNYPVVSLKKQPVNILTTVHYYSAILWDVGADTREYIKNLAESARYFEVNALLAILYFIVLILLLIADFAHVPVRQVVAYMWHKRTIFALRKKMGDKIHGRVFDDKTNTPVVGARVDLTDRKKRQVVATTLTDKNGDFSFAETDDLSYNLQVIQVGYEPIVFRQSNIEEVGLGGYLLTIQPHQKGLSVLEQMMMTIRTLTDLTVGTLLVFSLLGQIMIAQVIGMQKDWVFLTLSVVNILLWVWHKAHRHADRNVY